MADSRPAPADLPTGTDTSDWEIDPVSGLLRERHLPVLLQQVVAAARRKVLPVSVVFWELDGLGGAPVEAREQALTALGAVAWRTLRESDAVFRLGDVVAVAVLVDTAEPGALMVAERVREALRSSPVGDSLTVSAGIACYPTHALDAAELVARAGRALEQARDAGHERDHVAIADHSPTSAGSSAISFAYFAAIPRRLSFIVGVSSSESGSHSAVSTVNFRIDSACENRSLATATSRSTSACTTGSTASSASVVPVAPWLGGPRGDDVGIEHEQRGQVGPGLADDAGLSDQRLRLQRRLEVRGRDVLAARGDDELLLAVDDAQVAVVVELADVAGVQPAVGVERLGRALGIVEVAAEDVAAAAEHLAVVGQAQLHAGDGPPHRARAHPDRVPRHGPGRLRESVELRQRHARAAEELEDLDRDRGRGRDRDPQVVEAEQLPGRSQRLGVDPLVLGRELDRELLAAGPVLGDPRADLERLRRTPRRGSGSAASTACTVLWIFSNVRGTPKRICGFVSASIAPRRRMSAHVVTS